MYVAVKGGEAAIANAHRLLADRRRGDRNVPALRLDQIIEQLGLAVDRCMGEGSLYDKELAALAIVQARGDLIEAIFLVRAYRTTLPRFGYSTPVDTGKMLIERRISATFKDLPGGQLLGPTFDYTHRLLDPTIAENGAVAEGERRDADPEQAPRVTDLLAGEGLIESDGRTENAEVGDLTRSPLEFPLDRDLRLQALARGDEGFLLGLAYSTQRGYARSHPFVGEIRIGEVDVELDIPELGFHGEPRPHPGHRMPDGQPVQRLGQGAAAVHPRLRPRLRPERAQGHVDGALRPRPAREESRRRPSRRSRRTKSSSSRTSTTCSRPASSST